MNTNRVIRVVGMDPSLRNWGLATGFFVVEVGDLQISHLSVLNPVLPTGKQVRQNSQDLESAYQLYKGALKACNGAQAVFVEIPVGSQSARAMASYGVCVGILGSLRAMGIPFFEVTPTEVKMSGPGKKNASKQEMITWAMNRHPEANWPTYRQQGKLLVSEAKAEHMADACGAIHAGLSSNPFQQMLPLLVAKP
jgi:Holliday junction resolvasome RuvABC endonuclease subunit